MIFSGPVDRARLNELAAKEKPDATCSLTVIVEEGKAVSAWIALDDQEHYNPSVQIPLIAAQPDGGDDG